MTAPTPLTVVRDDLRRLQEETSSSFDAGCLAGAVDLLDDLARLADACREELRIGPNVGEADVRRRAALRARIDALTGPAAAASPLTPADAAAARILGPPAPHETAKACPAVRPATADRPLRLTCTSTDGHEPPHFDWPHDRYWDEAGDWPAGDGKRFLETYGPEADAALAARAAGRDVQAAVRERVAAEIAGGGGQPQQLGPDSHLAKDGRGNSGPGVGDPAPAERPAAGEPSPSAPDVGPSRTTGDGSANGRPAPRPAGAVWSGEPSASSKGPAAVPDHTLGTPPREAGSNPAARSDALRRDAAFRVTSSGETGGAGSEVPSVGSRSPLLALAGRVVRAVGSAIGECLA